MCCDRRTSLEFSRFLCVIDHTAPLYQAKYRVLEAKALAASKSGEPLTPEQAMTLRRAKRIANAAFSQHERIILEGMVDPSKIKESFATIGGLTDEVSSVAVCCCELGRRLTVTVLLAVKTSWWLCGSDAHE